MQRNSHPIPWRPRGLSDTLDASDSFKGAMASLQNLIPDPTTRGVWQCRPASQQLTNFTNNSAFSSGFSTGFEIGFGIGIGGTGFISAFKVLGNFAYGMIATNRNPGQDEPFCYNLLAGTFVAISGVTAGNTPASPNTTGAWVPPTMALIGALLIVTHPGFNGAGNGYIGILNVGNPAAPAWSSGNVGPGIAFSVPPIAVAQFNGRAYYIENVPAQPGVIFSDALAATTVTNANQVLTFGDNVALTAFGSLALFNQLGGIVQSLMVFKGVTNIFQITGDSALMTLAVNALNITTGTLAPNSVVSTPQGLAFVAPDGVRLIDFDAKIEDPLGLDGMGVAAPFIYSVVPSRIAAACSGNILRISTQNGLASGSPNQEFWYDFARGIWSGPHTFPASLIQPYSNTFVEAPIGVMAALWRSDPVQSGTSTYVENGQQLTWNATCAMLPDTDQMTENAMTEATLDLALSATIPNINVYALDQNGQVLNSVQITTPGGATIWGSFTWGAAPWGGAPNALAPRQLPWTKPVVFTRIQLQAVGQSSAGVKVGTYHLRYQILRYLSNLGAVA